MSRKAPLIVFDDEGTVGFLDPEAGPTGSGTVLLHLQDDRVVMLPSDALVAEPDGRYRLRVGRAYLDAADAEGEGVAVGSTDEEAFIPIVVEEVAVGKRRVESGRVRIRKGVETREESVDVPLFREVVEVERVAVNRPIDAPVGVRHEGDVMIVPVIEEVLVVEKRLVLKEELRITRRRVEERATERVTLRTETATVERDGPAGAPAR